jgi:large-conductance mechanosensitive channel
MSVESKIVKGINSTTNNIYQDFREFAIKHNIIGFATGWVIGISTAQLIRSFVVDVIYPIFGTKFPAKYRVIKFGKIKINAGNFVLELIHWVLMLLLIFIFVEYIFNRKIIKMKSTIPDDEIKEVKKIEKELEKETNDT